MSRIIQISSYINTPFPVSPKGERVKKFIFSFPSGGRSGWGSININMTFILNFVTISL